jgi:hypothetical protein
MAPPRSRATIAPVLLLLLLLASLCCATLAAPKAAADDAASLASYPAKAWARARAAACRALRCAPDAAAEEAPKSVWELALHSPGNMVRVCVRVVRARCAVWPFD